MTFFLCKQALSVWPTAPEERSVTQTEVGIITFLKFELPGKKKKPAKSPPSLSEEWNWTATVGICSIYCITSIWGSRYVGQWSESASNSLCDLNNKTCIKNMINCENSPNLWSLLQRSYFNHCELSYSTLGNLDHRFEGGDSSPNPLISLILVSFWC